ncbi:MAG: methylmalonyl Co-A mutase-associated GTPase MeaB [Bacteroidetes bacterium]|nr:methylmalonyl Co-A mutase-associated GTPase MeaB [Bacteroidota bacterium]
MKKNDRKTASSNSGEQQNLTAGAYVEGILWGDRVMLGRAITLVESNRPEHRPLAQEVLEKCLPHTGRSLRVGITGAPGVGKSSFIETLGTYLVREQGRRLAVLAIDPTSSVSRGSILGDKTRMEKLTTEPDAFIRPSPAGDSLGGVAASTRESMLLCEAAGFDTIFIETVGVGQSETTVAGMVDFFLLLLLPGAGDELQGIKRGIVEMADLLAINKTDGDRIPLAKAARQDYAQALHLFPAKTNGWQPKVVTCSALTGDGIAEIWKLLVDYQRLTTESGWFSQHRREQMKRWLHEQLEAELRHRFFQKKGIREKLADMELAVASGEISVSKALSELIKN